MKRPSPDLLELWFYVLAAAGYSALLICAAIALTR